MKYVDTNIILRVILRDNEELSPLAREILKTNECYVLPEVIPEAVYVLNKVYKFTRKDIAHAILQLLPLVVVKDVRLTRLALNYFSELNFDYVDCILLAPPFLSSTTRQNGMLPDFIFVKQAMNFGLPSW